MQHLDFNLLRTLDALIATGSVLGAAERLGITGSAASRALARIREATGDPILARAGRGMVKTPHALAIAGRVRATLQDVEGLLGKREASMPSDLERVFCVRADDAITAILGAAMIERLAARAPLSTLVFRAEGSEEVSELRDGRVDVDLGVQDALGPEIRVRKLFDDQRVVLRRKGGTHRRLTLRRFAESEHVDVSRRGRCRGPVDALLADHGLARHVRAVVPNQLAAAVLVAQCSAISLVSRRFATAICTQLPLEYLAAPSGLQTARIDMAWHPRFDADPGHVWLRQQIVALSQSN